MSGPLQIAKNFALPIDVVTDTIAFLARRNSGKTYACGVLVEEMLDAGVQVVVLDPVAKWWALRLAADGKSQGHSIPVFGGPHGDIPLGSRAGTLIADVLVDREVSAVLDLSAFTLSEQRQFVADFMTQLLYRRRAKPSPMHIVLEEAQEHVPQRVGPNEARMVGAVERVIKLGRNFGIGVSLISQRAASVNKDALTQTEVLCVLQTTGPQDRKAIHDWIDHTGAAVSKQIVDSLPSLKQGEMYIWSPGRNLHERIKFRKKKTFDASATPTVGARVETKSLAPVDLAAIEAAMASAIEQEKANDPRQLKERIRELEAKARSQQAVAPQVVERVVEQIVEVPALNEKELRVLSDSCDKIHAAATALQDVATTIRDGLDSAKLEAARTRSAASSKADSKIARKESLVQTAIASMQDLSATAEAIVKSSRKNGAHKTPESSTKLRRGARRMLSALGTFRDRSLTRGQLATLSGCSIKSGTFDQYLGDLRRASLIESGDELRLTSSGLAALGDTAEPVPGTTNELLNLWRPKLRRGVRGILDLIVKAYPHAVTRDRLADEVGGMKPDTFDQYVGDLRRCGLATTERDLVRASDTLFP